MTEALLVTQYYRPELVGSAPFCGDIAEWLAQAGWQTTVLTGLPNYPEGKVFAAYRGGAIRHERINGVNVERVRIWVPKHRSTFARITSEVWFLLLGCWALLSRRVKSHRLVVSLCPSIFALWVGALARHRAGRHVAIVHDIQSGLAQSLHMVRASWLVQAMRFCERITLNRVDLIVVPTGEMKEYLRQLGVTAMIDVVPIWADTDRIGSIFDVQDRTARLVYSGSFGRKQKLDQISTLAADLQERAPKIEILLRGRGNEFDALRTRIAGKGLNNVRFADLVATERLFDDMSGADIHLVVHDPSAANFAIPSKIYNILAAGLPCIAQAHPETALGRLQRESQGFLCVPADDPRALVDAALRLAGDGAQRRELGHNGRRYIEQHCAKKTVLDRFLTTVSDLLHNHGTGQGQNLLIFEPESEGHAEEWLRHLIRYARAGAVNRVVSMVVAPLLYERLAAELRGSAGDNLRLVPLRHFEANICCRRWLWLRGFARWWVARRYVMRTRAAAVQFLSLDLLALPLALGLPMRGCSIGGILFRPSTHYRFLGSYDPNWREKLRDLRKAILYRFMLSNRSVAKILTIDPYFAAYAARFYWHGTKLQTVADPVEHLSRQSSTECAGYAAALSIDSARREVKAPDRRVLLLLFGYLTERKGVLKLLDALRLVSNDVASRAAVMLVGKVDSTIRAVVQQKLAALHETRPTLFCCLEDRRVENTEIESLVRRADVVLAPYQRFVGSSGVMLWAARLSTPLLTQDFGVLGSLVRDHGLGMTVDCTKDFLLADAISRFVVENSKKFIDRSRARKFVTEHSAEKFAETVLTSVAT